MTVRDLYSAGIETQGTVVYCYYNYEEECRAEIAKEEATDLEIKYLYCEDGKLYIEVEKECLMNHFKVEWSYINSDGELVYESDVFTAFEACQAVRDVRADYCDAKDLRIEGVWRESAESWDIVEPYLWETYSHEEVMQMFSGDDEN